MEQYLRKRLKRLHERAKQHDPIRDWLFAAENRPRLVYLEDKRQQKRKPYLP